VSQLAEFLGISKYAVFNLTRQRTRANGDLPIPVIRIGRSLKFRRSSVEAWLAAKEEVR
jgi:predicted DNA-binding transcriptional regulator AlpA